MKIKNSCYLLGYFLSGLTIAVIAQKNQTLVYIDFIESFEK